ncbi:MAG: hypothetical protein ABUK13_08080 [Gammaproteobacteria bacterium]
MSITHHLSFSRTAIATLLATTLSAGITGCSSDSGTSSTTIDGSTFASAVNGASCTIQDINGNIIVDNITTSATGTYSASIPNVNLNDDLVLICNGGTYTNEANANANETAGMLAAFADGGTLTTGGALHATPDSTIMYQLRVQHQMTLVDAETAFSAAFGYTPDNSIAPTDATGPAAGATDAELLAGLHAATFSQLAFELRLTAAQQFELMLALADDISDGTLDGVNATVPVSAAGAVLPADIQNQFTLAMLNFRDTANGGHDASGLTSAMIGILPFAQTALTASYTVEYLKDTMGMMEMDAMEGKSQFQVRVTDSVGAPVSDTVSIMPMMHMATKTHSTPVDGACLESVIIAGTYDCTIYYLMASAMMDGTSMGYWDLKVMIGGMMGESTHFFPPVMMAMNGTALAKLKNDGDQIFNMMLQAAENRLYFLFKSSLTGMTGNHSFELFIAAKEDMMSFPAILTDVVLASGGSIADLVVNPIVIEVSTDPNFATGFTATENGNGYWMAAGITGLTNDVEDTLYVRMTINGTQYSTDGTIANGSNAVATFTVTPSAM